ncbi:unnamed protein product [Pleuronectes platessa]|uniref:Uncharacterized protein n=1 Tax=Pleuronectes platessa TaxID=8262 RepID=A0A9N7UYM9_PLEPL|nr:unnamed protein product [Pleuronectes platessa]
MSETDQWVDWEDPDQSAPSLVVLSLCVVHRAGREHVSSVSYQTSCSSIWTSQPPPSPSSDQVLSSLIDTQAKQRSARPSPSLVSGLWTPEAHADEKKPEEPWWELDSSS